MTMKKQRNVLILILTLLLIAVFVLAIHLGMTYKHNTVYIDEASNHLYTQNETTLFIPSYSYKNFGKPLSLLSSLQCDSFETRFPQVPKKCTTPECNKSALTAIPKLLFQSIKNASVISDRKQCGFISIKTRMSNFEQFVFSNQEQNDFVATFFPNLFSFFKSITYDIERVDFWRLLVIYRYGGVYLDADSVVLRPFDSWISMEDSSKQHIHLVFGIEGNIPTGPYPTARRRTLMNGQFAATPRHPFMAFLINYVIKTATLSTSLSQVGNFSGPGRLAEAMDIYLDRYHLTLEQVFNTNGNLVVDDIYFLSINGFGCGQKHSGSEPCYNHPSALVSEGFEGSWLNNK